MDADEFKTIPKEALAEQSAQFDEKLETKFAEFSGQILRHVDTRIDDRHTEVIERLDRIEGMIDNLAKRIDDDSQERAAMSRQLDRQARRLTRPALSASPSAIRDVSNVDGRAGRESGSVKDGSVSPATPVSVIRAPDVGNLAAPTGAIVPGRRVLHVCVGNALTSTTAPSPLGSSRQFAVATHPAWLPPI